MKKLTILTFVLIIMIFSITFAYDRDNFIHKQNPNKLSDEIVQYLNEKYFPDGVTQSAIQFLEFSAADMKAIKNAPGSKIFYGKEGFLNNPINIIVDTPNDGKIYLGYKNNRRVKESKIDDNQEFALTKLFVTDKVELPTLPADYVLPENFNSLLPENTSKEIQAEINSLLKHKKGFQILKEFALLKLNLAPEDLKYAIFVLKNIAESGFRSLNEEKNATILHSDADFMPIGEFYNNVYFALKARQDLPWCKSLDEELFMNYVLPHRCSEEQLFSWRARYYNALSPIVSKMKTLDEAKKFASSIYHLLVKYRYDVFFEDQGCLTMMLSHEGRCEEMTNFDNRLLMSIGIPAMHVYTPAWASGDGNHAWSGYYKDGKLNGGSGRKGAAKIYTRNGYGVRKDVTDEFGKIANFTLENLKPETDIFLNVWNHDGWVAVARYKTDEKGTLLAKNIGANRELWLSLSYSHHNYYNDNKYEPIGTSFLISENKTEFLKWDDNKKITFKTTMESGKFKKDSKYQILAYKNHDWVAVHNFTPAVDNVAVIEFSSCKTMFVLADFEGKRIGRPFIIADSGEIKGY